MQGGLDLEKLINASRRSRAKSDMSDFLPNFFLGPSLTFCVEFIITQLHAMLNSPNLSINFSLSLSIMTYNPLPPPTTAMTPITLVPHGTKKDRLQGETVLIQFLSHLFGTPFTLRTDLTTRIKSTCQHVSKKCLSNV